MEVMIVQRHGSVSEVFEVTTHQSARQYIMDNFARPDNRAELVACQDIYEMGDCITSDVYINAEISFHFVKEVP